MADETNFFDNLTDEQIDRIIERFVARAGIKRPLATRFFDDPAGLPNDQTAAAAAFYNTMLEHAITATDDEKYEAVWGTPVGKDCISLDSALGTWLGERLYHLAMHTNGIPQPYIEKAEGDEAEAMRKWKQDMSAAGVALAAYGKRYDGDNADAEATYEPAQAALRWVADYLGHLWD